MTLYDFDFSMLKLINGGIGVKIDREAIAQSIKHVLLTRPGEKLFDPDYGAAIGDYTDGSISILDSGSIKDDIFFALRNYMSDIIIIDKNDIEVIANKEKMRYDISIEYSKNDVVEKEVVSFSLTVNK